MPRYRRLSALRDKPKSQSYMRSSAGEGPELQGDEQRAHAFSRGAGRVAHQCARPRQIKTASDQLRATLFVEVAGGVGAASLRRRSIRVITRGSKAAAIMAWPSRVRWMKSRV